MPEILLIADTHIGHSKILEFEPKNRSFANIYEHDAEIVNRWNSIVTPKDTVIHGGDVLFGRHSFEILKELNGIKKLILGNHDTYPTALYLEYFNKVFGSMRIGKDMIFTHIPIHESQFYRFKKNIHGHVHSKSLSDNRYINVSADNTGLTPIPLDWILKND